MFEYTQGVALGYNLLAFQAVCRMIADNHNKERKMYDARRMRVEGRMILFCQRRRRFINTARVYINRGRDYINRGAVYKNTQTIEKKCRG